MLITWEGFKARAGADLTSNGAFIYRGQRDSTWRLVPSLYRTPIVHSYADLKTYADVVLPEVQIQLQAWTGKSWDLAHPHGLAEFLGFLQHHGFPTPLLDWTYSPYIAAYFAFESVNPFVAQNAHAAIYVFNHQLWSSTFKQHYDFADFTPHVSILSPKIVGNHKLAVQQGCFTWSTVAEIEGHIRSNEQDGRSFLTKYEIATSERPRVMRELSLMGITALQLMPSVEAVCKKALEDLIALHPLPPAQPT